MKDINHLTTSKMERAWTVNNSMVLEPQITHEATQRLVHIQDAKYEKADFQSVVIANCTHLSLQDQNKLLKLLIEFEELFDETLDNWNTKPVSFALKKGTKPYHGKLFQGPRVQP
jgi:hypothetical protein